MLSVLALGCAGSKKMTQADTPGMEMGQTGGNHAATGTVLSTWVDRTPHGDLPNAGEDCALIYDPRKRRLLLFGGKDDAEQTLNELWTLDLDANRWQLIQAAGEAPPASEDHTTIYDPVGYRLILYGGEDGPTRNETWSLDLEKHVWRNITDKEAPSTENHTAVYDSRGRQMVIFGGKDNALVNLYEAWALDLDPGSPGFEKWRILPAKEDVHPPGRVDHLAVYDSLRNRMVIYGGWDKKGKNYLNDTWAYSFADSTWQKIKTKKSYPPKRRRGGAAYHSARNWFVIFGGFGDEGYLNDAWAFDLSKDVWINVTPGPQPRIDHRAAYNPISKNMIFYGGDASLGSKFHDLWELQINTELPLEGLLKEAGAKK